ncbi:MAG TPA: PAS domain S-box protein [Candidatus Nanoarchaeia archaeon]
MSSQKVSYKINTKSEENRNTPFSEDYTYNKQLEARFRKSEYQYRTCFKEAPISLWEEDFSNVKKYFDRLSHRGIKNFGEFFKTHPKAVSKCASLVKIVDVNKATLKFYKAKNKRDLKMGLDRVFGEESYDTFREELIALAEGKTKFGAETSTRTLKGSKNYIALRVKVVPGYEGTLSKVLISIVDLTRHQQIEEALRTSGKKYSTLVEKGNDGIIIIQDGILKFVNQKSSEITGFSVKEAMGRPFIGFVSPEYRGLVMERYKKRLNGEKVPGKYEIEILAKNGRKIPIEVSASLIEHEGKPADMALLRDITDRKEAGRILEEEKRKMEILFKTTEEGLALYDKEGRVVDINPALKKLFGVKRNIIGVKREEITTNRSKYFKNIVERFDDSLATQKEVYSGRAVSNILMKVYSKPPKYLEANYVPIKGKKGAVIGMSASFRDVTVLKNQAEKIGQQLLEVEKQKNRAQAIFNNVEEGAHVFDKHLRIINANSACELMSGFSEKEMVGKNYYDTFRCHDKFEHYYPEFDPVSKVLATKESVPYDEHLHVSKDGKERWVGVSYTPIFDEKGEVEQIVSVVRDITTIKELEESKSEFVSLASHELRTPLTVINGYLSLLLGGDLGSLDKEQTRSTFLEVLNKVQHETERLTNLVGDLLNVSRIEEGRLKLSFKKVAIAETINEVISEFKPMAAVKGVRVRVLHDFEKGGDSLYVLADRGKLKQVFVNLLDNAVKYTDSGGEIVAKCSVKNGQIFIQIKDTGIGIPPNMLPRVFEKFQQAGGSFLKENKGTGLGLFIVKSLVELHKGKIWVNSKVGRGTTFSFTLPIVAAK